MEQQIKTLKQLILNDYKDGVSIATIAKNYDLYIESEFDGSWKRMNKKQIENSYKIKF
jgi:hypothetical protein